MTLGKVKMIGSLAIVGLVIGGLFVWRYQDEILAIDVQAMVEWIKSFGPIPFFAAMAILPLFWAPVSPFLIVAGAAYDLPVALGGCGLALSVNMAVSWLLAGKLFRPAFERLVHRFGYSVPEITPKTMITVAVLLRITPGLPFPLQNYLLGLAKMPFGWYMAISVPLTMAMATSIIIFSDAILKGNKTVVILAVVLFIALGLIVGQVRARLKRNSLAEDLP
ncbi:MAG: putative membrane protein YdjX (TVP38/TMEM64 family) [Candidatus Pelagisphaera sp.]